MIMQKSESVGKVRRLCRHGANMTYSDYKRTNSDMVKCSHKLSEVLDTIYLEENNLSTAQLLLLKKQVDGMSEKISNKIKNGVNKK